MAHAGEATHSALSVSDTAVVRRHAHCARKLFQLLVARGLGNHDCINIRGRLDVNIRAPLIVGFGVDVLE